MNDPEFAAKTSVPFDRSRADIERTLERYGAQGFAYVTRGDRAVIEFVAHGRRVRILLDLPDREAHDHHRTAVGRTRSVIQSEEAWKNDGRQRWRALALVVKAKLEAVSTGIVSFEDEFAVYTVLPDGRTVAEHVQPAIMQAYETGQVPRLLRDQDTRPEPAPET